MPNSSTVQRSSRVCCFSPLSLLAAVALFAAGPRVGAQATSNTSKVTDIQTPVSFDLADQFGRRWNSDSLAGRWVVLVLGERAHSARMTRWSDSLSRAFGAESTTVRAFMVADLRAVPRMMQRFALQRAPRESHRRLLLDRDGGVSRQLGLNPRVLNVVVIAPDRLVRLRLVDTQPSTEHIEVVHRLVNSR